MFHKQADLTLTTVKTQKGWFFHGSPSSDYHVRTFPHITGHTQKS